VAAYPVDATLAAEFGVIEAQPDGLIVGFHEKRPDAPQMPGHPGRVYASMGNYIFNAETLLEVLETDSLNPSSRHDFGHDILPSLIEKARMYAYEFRANTIPGETDSDAAYWRDVGSVDAYYDAHMDLCGVTPSLNLYNSRWPIRTASYPDPAAKFTYDDQGQPGQALGSIVSGGCILSGGIVRNSILGRGVFVDSGAIVEDSIVFDNCRVGRRARIRRVIIDENTSIPNYEEIGCAGSGQSESYEVSPGGVLLVTPK
jgi:glucose-1-phosphate adenylyltransferase